MARAFADPHISAADGWEPLAVCRERVTAAVAGLIEASRGEDLVLVGHGTAWTVLVSALTEEDPDLARLADLGMPDVIVVELGRGELSADEVAVWSPTADF